MLTHPSLIAMAGLFLATIIIFRLTRTPPQNDRQADPTKRSLSSKPADVPPNN